MSFLLELAWRDLKASGRGLWIFLASLVLGVSLVAAGGGLYQQVTDSLRADVRLLFGGDVEIESREPLPKDIVQWVHTRATLSEMIDVRTMLMTEAGRSQLIELLSVDRAYPLYGSLVLEPAQDIQSVITQQNGQWGAAIDRALATRLGLGVGDTVSIGQLMFEVRAIVIEQPDRSLRADWGAAPVLIAKSALEASGLLQPFSRVQYQYRVKLDGGGVADAGVAPKDAQTASGFRDALLAVFPTMQAEVRSFDERSDRMTEVLQQIGSGLLLVGFSALFIGGLGVFNSIKAHLDSKLASLATLRAIGLRDGRLALFVLLQVFVLAALASGLGTLVGGLLALAGASMVGDQLPTDVLVLSLAQPLVVAWVFGVLTALTFALPAIGRALSVSPAVLFRGIEAGALKTPRQARWLTAAVGGSSLVLLVVVLPDPRFALAFVVAVAALLWVLLAVIRVIKSMAARAEALSSIPLSLRLALAGLQQPHSPMRMALISLGTALTLLVACTLVVMALLRMVNETVPAQAPAMVFYDIQPEQLSVVGEVLRSVAPDAEVKTAPFVLGRLAGVNGKQLTDSGNLEQLRESRDEHKLSDTRGNFDDVVIEQGSWWPDDYAGPPVVAMEDREANELGLKVGDRLSFEILGQTLEAELVAIYAQRRMQARLWLEAIFNDGALDPVITRYVGAAWLPAVHALTAQDQLAAVAPNIATARTESILNASRALLGRASGGLVVIALVCLGASLLVLASVVAASRSRQLYDATVMHALGARHGLLVKVLLWEYALIALVTAAFAVLFGSVLASELLAWRLDIDPAGLYWSGVVTAFGVSLLSLGLGARYLLSQMRLNPAMLLRTS
jgi:putative ABC transport system permease protein